MATVQCPNCGTPRTVEEHAGKRVCKNCGHWVTLQGKHVEPGTPRETAALPAKAGAEIKDVPQLAATYPELVAEVVKQAQADAIAGELGELSAEQIKETWPAAVEVLVKEVADKADEVYKKLQQGHTEALEALEKKHAEEIAAVAEKTTSAVFRMSTKRFEAEKEKRKEAAGNS